MIPRWIARLFGLGATVFLSLGAVSFFPSVAAPLLGFWTVALCLDVRSTWRMYRLEPESFSENESNIFFVPLYERLGFWKSVPLFLALVEIPRFVLIGLFLAPLVAAPLMLTVPRFAAFGVAAAAQGYAHLEGWWVNRRFLSSKKGLFRSK